MKLHETLLGLLLMALAAAVFAYTATFPAMPGQKFGPSLFPRVVTGALFACGLILAVRGWRSGARGVTWDEALREPRRLVSFIAMPLAIGAYLLLADRLGFVPTAALIVATLAAWFGARWWTALLLGVAASGVVNWFFGSVMRVPLPRGWFMQVVAGG